MNAASQAVRKVRLQRLSLAGFGCYRCATHFELGGGSRVFIARNECGKSTFLRGLLYTLFGVPGGKRRQLFLRRYYNWDRPEEFWGSVEFECNGERWTVVRDFRRDTVTVTARGSEGDRIVLNRHRHRERTTESRRDPYDDLLDSWFGIRARSVYEGIFCIDQRSTVLQRSQIDERVWKYVYGEAAAGIERERRRIYERFRQLTCRTRDYGVTLAAGGGRNGRTPGRIEQVVEELERARQRYAQLKADLERTSEPQTADLGELEHQLENLRHQLSTWERWVWIQERLLQAVQAQSGAAEEGTGACEGEVEDGENGELGALRALAERGMSAAELRSELERLAEKRDEHQRLAEEAEELDEQIGELQQQLHSLRQEQQASGVPRDLEATLQELLRLKAVLSELDRLEQVRAELEVADSDGELTDEQAELLSKLCAVAFEAADLQDHYRTLSRELESVCEERRTLEVELERLETSRKQARDLLEKQRSDAEEQRQQTCRLREKLRALETQHKERFAVLEGAPPGLPMLWDRLHALRQQLEQVDRALQQRDLADRLRRSRIRWRRLLLGLGVSSTLAAVVFASGWVDLLVGLVCGGLTVLAARVFQVPSLGQDLDDLRGKRRELEAESRAILSMLGTRFAPKPDIELEVRRLWPEYEQSLAALDRVRSELRRAEEAEQATASERERVVGDLSETIESLDREIVARRSRLSELDQRHKRLREELQAALDRWHAILGELHGEPVGGNPVEAFPIPEALRFVEKLVGPDDFELDSLQGLVKWVAENAERLTAILNERQRRTSNAAQQWQSEVWWSMQNVGLGPEDAGESSQAPQGFDAEAAFARLRSEAEELRTRLAPLDESADPEELERSVEDAKALASLIEETEDRLGQLMTRRAELQQQLESARDAAEGELGTVLDLFGADVERAVEEFERILRGANAEDGAEGEIAELRRQARELMAQFPELVAALEQPPDYARQRRQELEAEVERLEASLAEARRLAGEAQTTAVQLRSELDEISATIARLEDELQGLEQERDELAARFRTATEQLESLQKSCRASLERRISALFASFSCQPERSVVLDEELHVMIRDQESHVYVPAHLSHGARDQLCLAVYLALADNLDLPFVFDDPFVNCDEERLAAIHSVWEKLSETRQLILLSHSAEFTGWAEPLEIRRESGQTPQRAAA